MGKIFNRNRNRKGEGYNKFENILPSPPGTPVKKSPHSKSPACKTPPRNTPRAASAAKCRSHSKERGAAIPFYLD